MSDEVRAGLATIFGLIGLFILILAIPGWFWDGIIWGIAAIGVAGYFGEWFKNIRSGKYRWDPKGLSTTTAFAGFIYLFAGVVNKASKEIFIGIGLIALSIFISNRLPKIKVPKKPVKPSRKPIRLSRLLWSYIIGVIGLFFIIHWLQNRGGIGLPIGIGAILLAAYIGKWFSKINLKIPSTIKEVKMPDISKPEINIQTGQIKSMLGSVWDGIATFLGWGDIQVDGWAAFVPERGKLADKLEKGVISAVEKRGLENLAIGPAELGIGNRLQALAGETRMHTVFKQEFGGGASSTLALRIAQRGNNDLEISWRLFENNAIKRAIGGSIRGFLIVFGILWSLMSLILIPLFGIGLITLPIGVIIIGLGLGWSLLRKGGSPITTYQQFDSRVLLQTVDFSLMTTLEDEGVSKEELRIIVASQSEGIGKLGA